MSISLVLFSYNMVLFATPVRNGDSVVDNTLDYQSRDRKIDPRFSGLSDENLNRGPVSV